MGLLYASGGRKWTTFDKSKDEITIFHATAYPFTDKLYQKSKPKKYRIHQYRHVEVERYWAKNSPTVYPVTLIAGKVEKSTPRDRGKKAEEDMIQQAAQYMLEGMSDHSLVIDKPINRKRARKIAAEIARFLGVDVHDLTK